MILNRQRLLNVFSILSTATSNKVMQVADYVHFRIISGEKKVFISSTDFSAFITVDYGDVGPANLDDLPSEFLVHFKTMYAIMKASTTDEVNIVQPKQNGQIVLLTNGRYSLPSYKNIEEFPVSNFKYNELGKWSVPVIQSAWNKASIGVSKDVTKIAYQGVNYDGSFAACDNRRLAIAVGDQDFKGDPILLMPSFGDILKHCKNEVSVGPSPDGHHFIVVCEEVGMIASTRTIDAKFVDYKQLLATKVDALKIILPKNDLVGAVSRLMIFTDQLYKAVTMKVCRTPEGACIELSVSNKSAGTETVNINDVEFVEDDKYGVVFENRYHLDNLLDGISVTEDADQVMLNIQEDGKLWMEETNFQYLLTTVQD